MQSKNIHFKESDTGLAPPALWDLAADKQSLQSEQPLQVGKFNPSSNQFQSVARLQDAQKSSTPTQMILSKILIEEDNLQRTKINETMARYIINVKQFAKFVVDLADSVAPTDIEEGMRVGVDRNK